MPCRLPGSAAARGVSFSLSKPYRPTAIAAAPLRPAVGARRGAALVVAFRGAVRRPGRSFAPDQLHVERALGSGSYGEVFKGQLDVHGTAQPVVLKRVKSRVQDGEEMGEMEVLMNVHAAKSAARAVAPYLGFCDVPAGAAAPGGLSPGLWLLWRYEGCKTLASYLGRRDGLRALASDLGVPEALVVPVALRQVLSNLAVLHASGLIHRDVKPLNLVVAENDRRLKLIDLGSCADLRSGVNFHPQEYILDPMYAPPEQYVLPTDSPHLARSLLGQAMSPLLWARHQPDRFDSWSAGVVLLCLALPHLRTDAGLSRFLSEFEAAQYDLDAWRARCKWVAPRDFAPLDADGGAGWEVARGLLRPRNIRVAPDGHVAFLAGGGARWPARLSAAEALRQRFFKLAAQRERAYRAGGDAALAAALGQAAAPAGAAAAPAAGKERPARGGGTGGVASAERKPSLAAR
ncbi:hypothetical protein Rsub_00394 [Raphidocelis subcapitata]|uniref:Protein kinase domain-containing protein n=1 Tax=Raphidocelis subcapitata TaxID=307507 RepID=A0A2V0NQ77_9CHLO|nr:hypothetical protein Rsub_00394 [Raphidocelis subcapitata]|eukprot:GBF87683.1 hypothetical protein Rsub_00394 [Raphidocelis subcapitata]